MLASKRIGLHYKSMNAENKFELIEIHHSFAETDFGKTLASKVRYERYKPAGVTNERWTELLGADVGNLSHLQLTYGLTKSMNKHLQETQPGLLDQEEEELLKTAALIHDWGEAIVGDISYSDKTEEDEVEEREQLSIILDQHTDNKAPQMKELIEGAANNVVFNPDSKLGHIFNTVERIGYMRTGLRAGYHIQHGNAADCEHGLRWLVADVFGNIPPELLKRSATYIPVRDYLDSQSAEISRTFGLVHPETFENYLPEQREAKIAAFYSSRSAWVYWLSTRTSTPIQQSELLIH